MEFEMMFFDSFGKLIISPHVGHNLLWPYLSCCFSCFPEAFTEILYYCVDKLDFSCIDGKKGVHVATPHPSKGVKTPNAKAQTPKSGGQVSCSSCSKYVP